ncbi:hypothetical protein ACWDR0_19170 [Streptomyces sp. NPDC003691]
MPTRRQTTRPYDRRAIAGSCPGDEGVEAILVERYPRLVRLAYLTLPPSLGRHRRVLAAHATVQGVLPVRSGRAGTAAGGEEGPESAGYRWVRHRVLRGALRGRRAAFLPRVVGLRMFPSSGGAEELALDQALSSVGAPARAALALGVLEGLAEEEAGALLAECGVADPAEALRTAAALRESGGGRVESLLRAAEFDPCVVQTRPTDLLRRRGRVRAAAAAGLCALLVTGLAVAGGPAGEPGADRTDAESRRPASWARALDPVRLVRADGETWADTSRVDFTAWPARGTRKDDAELLRRALAAWSSPGDGVRVSATAETERTPPALPPRLLYAGDADGAAVVLLHEGGRVVRYAEPLSGRGAAALDFARVDDADVTTAASVVVSRTAAGTRLLLAPWVAEAAVVELLAPGRAARGLAVTADGVTAAVPNPSADGAEGATGATGATCTARPALRLRSSDRIVENHAFLVADLGDLVPAHLTYTPPPGSGVPARQPREATGGPASAAWARGACALAGLRGAGVRAVNLWTFAEQRLPDGAGRAAWVCTRADTWSGPGRVLVRFEPPGRPAADPGTVVAKARSTAACSRFGQHVLAGVRWRSPAGKEYLLAAGSRAVGGITASGAVAANASGTTLAAALPGGRRGPVVLTARLRTGGTLPALGGPVAGAGAAGAAGGEPPVGGADPGADEGGPAGGADN